MVLLVGRMLAIFREKLKVAKVGQKNVELYKFRKVAASFRLKKFPTNFREKKAQSELGIKVLIRLLRITLFFKQF